MDFGGPGLANGVAGDIIGSTLMPPVSSSRSQPSDKMAANGPEMASASSGRKARSPLPSPGPPPSAENRGEAVLDQAVIDFVAGNNQSGLACRKGSTGSTAPFAGDASGPFNGGPLHDQGNGPGGRHLLAFFHRHVVVQGGAHDLVHQVEGGQSRDVHL